ncbi:hypothetical protein H0H81_006881 [Sphagnurus paluster]|uniref:Uncharacterized protein n=1 Tax=Sphagnurus paluster TaxID=117069 RepID=A0A9P7GJT5_9AGAR|nr:hypothetical protein H0H81_006881 [Sphagnurus paluster]
MFSTLFTIALIAAPALADFAVNTPALTQCKDAKISWEATKGPYNIIAVAAENPCGDSLADLGDFTSTSTTWKAALLAGSKVQLSVEDANGDEAWSGTITVQNSDDTSCLPADVVKPSAGTPAGFAPQSSSAVSSAASTSASSAAVSPSSAPAPGSASGSASGSTIVVIPTTFVTEVVPESTSGAAPSAIGAAGNAGTNPFGINKNGAINVRQASAPVMVLGALAAALAFSL